MSFDSSQFLSPAWMTRITDARVNDPERSLRAAAARVRRERMTSRGKLNILAADHPARGVTKVGDNPLAMADRRDYLSRIARVLSSDGVDGLMATMDIIEELLIVDSYLREAGGKPLLDGKVLIASLNRAGLANSVWELDDPISGPTPATCAEWHLDGAKFLLRIALDDAGSLKTLLEAAEAMTQSNALGLPFFLEPLPVKRTDKGWTVVKTPEALANIAGVASALGDSSRHMWLKLPYCNGYETVARSTSLPILLLGGEAAGGPAPFLQEMSAAISAGGNIRGALVGRNVLYPGDDDPQAMAAAVGGIIHDGWSVDLALERLAAARNQNLDRLSRYI